MSRILTNRHIASYSYRLNNKMMNSHEIIIKTKSIIYAVIIFLSLDLAGVRCNNEATDNCVGMLEQFDQYHNIAVEITDISCSWSCPLSKSSHFKGTTTGSSVSKNFKEIVQNFNPTCRRYIDALAFKYQL